MALHGLGDQIAIQPVGEQFGKVIDELAQVGAALEGHARDVGTQQVAQGAGEQAPHVFGGAALRGHFGHDADAQAQLDVGGDDVRVNGFEHDARLQLALGKGLVNEGAAREGRVVGDERPGGNVFQRDALLPRQRVVDVAICECIFIGTKRRENKSRCRYFLPNNDL